MKNIVIKAALIAVGAVAAAGILIFSLWILISPQSMATVSEKLGNYSFAVTCADLKFKYSDDTADLARCAEDSILSGEDGLVLKYCGLLVEKNNFDEVCRQKDVELARTWQSSKGAPDYRTYIIGNLAAAQYRSGELEKAVKTAETGKVECFNKLVIEIFINGSEEDMQKLQNSLTRLDVAEYVKGLIELFEK